MKNLEDWFIIEPGPQDIYEVDTPVPSIDLEIVERNLVRWQARCQESGLRNRPHIKTHKLVPLARYQLELGACGLTVQKLGEAEVMCSAGISNLLLTFNIVGRPKLARLVDLARKTDIAVVADSDQVIYGLAEAGLAARRPLDVFVECDTGGKRNGVQSAAHALELAQLLDRTPGVRYAGLMTFPAPGARRHMGEFLAEAKCLLEGSGLETRSISSGGTPDMWSDEGLEHVTEYRAGTYIFNDRSLVERGVCSQSDCAVDIVSTVVSRPTADRIVMDAGSKSLTSDLHDLSSGYGVIRGSDASLYALSEEHGLLHVRKLPNPPMIGDILRIIPNHVCPVINLFDRVLLTRGQKLIGYTRVDARGAVT